MIDHLISVNVTRSIFRSFFHFAVIFLLSVPAAAETEDGGAEDYRIVEYDVSVRVPGTYDRLEIDALLGISKLSREAPDSMRVLLGENFRGAAFINVTVSDMRNEQVPFTFEDSLLDIDISRVFGESSQAWLLLEYDMVKDTSFYDQYSPFSWEISDSLCHINSSITRTDNWYPKIAGTMSERIAPYRLTIDVPAKFEVMASGRLEDMVTEQGRKTYSWQNYEGVTDRSLYFFAQEQSRTVREFPDGLRIIMYTPSN
ncbi:MAG: hypothetical protein OEV79_12340, partial [candidate division WOR-3 bacterium]|nr:hypothetical protein [candidate division WOR-3 bacterium]